MQIKLCQTHTTMPLPVPTITFARHALPSSTVSWKRWSNGLHGENGKCLIGIKAQRYLHHLSFHSNFSPIFTQNKSSTRFFPSLLQQQQQKMGKFTAFHIVTICIVMCMISYKAPIFQILFLALIENTYFIILFLFCLMFITRYV